MKPKPKPWEADWESGSNLEEDAKEPLANEADPLVLKDGPEEPQGFSETMDNLQKYFGYELLSLLFVVQHLLKGFVHSLIGQAEPYLFRAYHVPAPQMQIYGGISALPWALKPMIGLLSDTVPIFGYNKAPYMLMTTFIGAIGLLLIGVSTEATMTVRGLVVCLFIVTLQISTCDLLSEAKYAEKIREYPKHGPSLMSYVWFGMQVGGLVAIIASGFLLENTGVRSCFLVAVLPAATVFIPVTMGFMQESRKSREEVSEARKNVFKQWEACALCVAVFLGIMYLVVMGIASKGDPFTNCVAAISVGIVLLICFSLVLSPTIAKFNAFSLIQTSLSLQMSGAAFYFFTDTPEQYPEGPHFSEFFFNSVMGTAGAIFSLVGIYAYQQYMSHWSYRNLLLTTNVTFAVLSLFDLILFTRRNVKMGIPDEAFVLSCTVLGAMINQWRWMPAVVILSHLCPKGMEAIMYALLAGCHNLGNMVAASCGAYLLEVLNCKPNGSPNESKQFENLWVASAITTALPLVTIIALFWLIPDARQDEKLLDDSECDATRGSIYRQWSGRG
jgi:folate/biopterin transporter